jgi:uncharacterized UPF0146 family protein
MELTFKKEMKGAWSYIATDQKGEIVMVGIGRTKVVHDALNARTRRVLQLYMQQ